MPREFSRIDRIGDQMQRELAQLIQREVKDPRVGMVTVNAVKVSRDLGYADIYVSLLSTEELTEESPEVKESIAVLNKASGFLRGSRSRDEAEGRTPAAVPLRHAAGLQPQDGQPHSRSSWRQAGRATE